MKSHFMMGGGKRALEVRRNGCWLERRISITLGNGENRI